MGPLASSSSVFTWRFPHDVLEELGQVGLRRESKIQGNLLNGPVCFCQLSLDVFDDSIIDNAFGTAAGDATADLTEIGTAHIELVSIGGDITLCSKILANERYKVVIELCASSL